MPCSLHLVLKLFFNIKNIPKGSNNIEVFFSHEYDVNIVDFHGPISYRKT